MHLQCQTRLAQPEDPVRELLPPLAGFKGNALIQDFSLSNYAIAEFRVQLQERERFAFAARDLTQMMVQVVDGGELHPFLCVLPWHTTRVSTC